MGKHLALNHAIIVNGDWNKVELLHASLCLEVVCHDHIKDLVIAWVLNLASPRPSGLKEKLDKLVVLKQGVDIRV